MFKEPELRNQLRNLSAGDIHDSGGPSAALTARGFPKAQPASAGVQLSPPRSSLSLVQDSLCPRKPLKGHCGEHTAGKSRALLSDPWILFCAAHLWLNRTSSSRLGVQNPSGVLVLRKRPQQLCPRLCLTTLGPERDISSSHCGGSSLGIPWLAGSNCRESNANCRRECSSYRLLLLPSEIMNS